MFVVVVVVLPLVVLLLVVLVVVVAVAVALVVNVIVVVAIIKHESHDIRHVRQPPLWGHVAVRDQVAVTGFSSWV